MRLFIAKIKRLRHEQSGLASIIIVMMLVIVVTLISLGISRLVDRASRQSLSNNLSAAADYAARSGVSDVVALLEGIPNTTSPNCNTLFAAGQPFANRNTLSTNANARYTCILIDKNPSSIDYQNMQPYKSRIIAIAPKDKISRFMFSWQSSSQNPEPNFPSPSGNNLQLFDESYWANNNYAPMLRISILQVKNDLSNSSLSWKTDFLYPKQASGSTTVTNYDFNSTADGSLLPVSCVNKAAGASALSLNNNFNGTANLDCNLILSNFDTSNLYYYYIRVTPLYTNADVEIQADQTSGGQLKTVDLGGTQYVIDVTAQAGNAVKRLQARVTAPYSSTQFSLVDPNDNSIPEYAVRSSDTICKRLEVFSAVRTVYLDSDPITQAYCSLNN